MTNKSKGIHWISLLVDRNTTVYFDSFGIKYIPQKVLNKIKDKSITHSRFRIQSDNSVVRGCYCITFTYI